MLPHRDKRNRQMPTIIVDSDSEDLLGEARKRAMSRFINAVHSQNLTEALDAFQDLFGLTDD